MNYISHFGFCSYLEDCAYPKVRNRSMSTPHNSVGMWISNNMFMSTCVSWDSGGPRPLPEML